MSITTLPTPAITSLSQLDPDGYYTYSDYLTWKFKERVEILKGMIKKMSPAPNRRHQQLSGFLFVKFYNHLEPTSCQVFSAPFDVRLPVSKKAGQIDTVVQPDIVVICDQDKLDTQGCNGAPDLVVEILSPGNTHLEMKDKFDLYEASLIPEYWIVDPERDSILVYTLNNEKKYIGSKPFVTGEEFTSSTLEGLVVNVGAAFQD